MVLWDYDENDLLEDTTSGNYISKSGCYDMQIESTELINSTESKAQAIVLILSNDTEKARVSLWFRGKNGETVDFVKRLLNHVCFLAKIKASDLEIKTMTEDNKRRVVIPKLANKSIGAFIKVKVNDQGNYDHILKGYMNLRVKRLLRKLRKILQTALNISKCIKNIMELLKKNRLTLKLSNLILWMMNFHFNIN